MSTETTPELTSWKEIAQRLQVSVRTAQLWEKERGLPIRRVPGKRGRVYLREEDLVVWLHGHEVLREEGGEAAEPSDAQTAVAAGEPAIPFLVSMLLHPPLAFMIFAGALVLALIIVWASTVQAPETGEPATWRIEPDMLVVSNRMGHPLFSAYFSEGLREEPYGNGENFEPRIADLDGDGVNEVIFSAFTDRAEESALIVFDAYGRELWRHRPGLLVSTAREAFDDIYTIADVHLLPQPDGTQDVLLSAHHRIFYPTVLTRLGPDGAVKARYWHAGHIGHGADRLIVADVDTDGKPEVLLTGVSNARNAATLILLDPEDMDGAAYEPELAYRFQQLPVAHEVARIFFPRSSLTPADDRYNVASAIVPGRSTFTVSVEQVLGDAAPHILYTFSPEMELLKVTADDSFVGKFQLARQTGAVEHSLDEELADLEAITLADLIRPNAYLAGPPTAPTPAEGGSQN
jgi:hypothetical protein